MILSQHRLWSIDMYWLAVCDLQLTLLTLVVCAIHESTIEIFMCSSALQRANTSVCLAKSNRIYHRIVVARWSLDDQQITLKGKLQ